MGRGCLAKQTHQLPQKMDRDAKLKLLCHHLSQNSLKDNELIEQWRPSPHSYVCQLLLSAPERSLRIPRPSLQVLIIYFPGPVLAPSLGQAGMEAEGGSSPSAAIVF